MSMYNLIEHSDNYSKTSGSLWKYYRNEPDAAILDFKLFKFKIRIIGKTPADGNIKDVKITVPLIFGELLKCYFN